MEKQNLHETAAVFYHNMAVRQAMHCLHLREKAADETQTRERRAVWGKEAKWLEFILNKNMRMLRHLSGAATVEELAGLPFRQFDEPEWYGMD